MKDTNVKNEVNTTLSKFTEEELYQLKLLFKMSALFPYPPNWDLEMKCKESLNKRKNILNSMFSVDLTEEEVISIIKEYGVTKEEAISIQKEIQKKNQKEIPEEYRW